MVMRNKLLPVMLAVTVVAGTTLSGVSRADQMAQQVFDESRPTHGAMLVDAVLGRPALLGATVLGAVVFVGTLPFSLLGGGMGTAWDTLVAQPGKSTFFRCLGCTPVQHERAKAERAQDDAAPASDAPAN